MGRSAPVNAPGGSAQPLLRFTAALGGDTPDFSHHERLADIRFYDETFPASSLAALDFETLDALKEAYGDALQLKILRGDQPLLDLQKAFDQALFDRFQRRLAASHDVVLDLVLDKRAYARNLLEDVPQHCHLPLYLFPERLHNYLLAARLTDLEADLWPDRAAKTLLLLPTLDICMDGPLLAIFGGRYIGRWQEAFSEKVDAFRPQRIYASALESLRWEDRWLAYLTPLHLFLQSRTEAGIDDNHALVTALRMHLANAILLYTAERTVKRGDSFLSTFATSRATVDVPHLAAAALQGDGHFAAGLARGLGGLQQTFEWAYEPPWKLGERLPVVQIALVNALRAALPQQRYQVLLNNATQIYDNLEWTWREFLDERFDDYLGKLQQVEAYVGETVSGHSRQVTELVKNVSETMLAAVGVTLASFVAALFQDNFDATVFRIGIWAYAAYVFFFPLLYSLSSQLGRYKALEQQLQRRRQRFEQRLHPDAVKDIVGDEVQASRRRFSFWFRMTATVYFLVIALALIAAFAVPTLFPPPAIP